MIFDKLVKKLFSPLNSADFDDEEHEKHYQKNKRFLSILFLLLSNSIIFPITTFGGQRIFNIPTTIYIFLLFSYALFSKCNLPGLNWFILFTTVIMGPIQFYLEAFEGLALIRQALIFPIGVFILTKNVYLFSVELLAEIFYIITIYRHGLDVFLKQAMEQGYHIILRSASFQTIAGLVFCFLILAIVHHDNQVLESTLEASEKLRMKSERQKTFILGISHEIRNLVNSITGCINLCLLEDCSKTVRENLKNAQLSCELLVKEINNVLDSGKIELGELEIKKNPCLAAEIFPKYWRIYTEIITRKRLKGTLFISKAIPSRILIDEFRFSQILLNLVGNATKFTEKGSINLTIDWVPNVRKIDEEIFKPNPYDDDGLFEKDQALGRFNSNYDIHEIDRTSKVHAEHTGYKPGDFGVLKVTVRDTGCGVESKDLDKLFNKFAQVGTKSSRKIGSGLGLFICKQLIEKMEGDIKIFSKKGVGTTLVVAIPCEIPEVYMQSMAEIPDRRIKTMIVDDVDMNVGILAQFLRKLSYPVNETAVNGQQAFDKYVHHYKSRSPITFITMDINMPIMDGKTAVQKIREYEVENKITPCTIVMVSANCSHSEIYDCTNQKGKIRADGFLSKPVSLEDLRNFLGSKISSSMRII